MVTNASWVAHAGEGRTSVVAGGGFALVLGSGIRLSSRSAKFNAAFIRIGLSACDIGTSWLLPRIVGVARAQELMLTGRVFDAMRNSPFGVALTKGGMWGALEIPGLQNAIGIENRQQNMASATADHREAMAAFAERRLPLFTNG